MPDRAGCMKLTAYTYCHHCGTKYPEAEHRLLPRHIACVACGRTLYLNPKPTATGWFEKGNKILLVQRSLEPGKGAWGTVGGFMEYGETPEQTLMREAKEEIGVDIKIDKFLGTKTDLYDNQQGEVYSTLGLVYFATLLSENFKLAEELSDAKWFGKNDLPQDIGFPSTRWLIENWRDFGRPFQNA